VPESPAVYGLPFSGTGDHAQPGEDAAVPNTLLDALNPEQKEAVTHGEGPALVIAGAGSGKTRVIAHRIAWLLTEKHTSPRSILAVTFTNKASDEMRNRVMSLMDKPALPFLWIGTFHSICARLLRADVEALGGPYNKDFTILDADDAAGLVRRILRDRGVSERNFQPKAVRAAISRAKTEGVDSETFAAKARGHFAQTIAPIYRTYENQLRSSNVVDFDDLLLIALHLLESVEPVRRKYQEQFRHILVDEYQDTNRIQYRLLRLLSERWGNIFAVGDEDQSIYRWRGADIQNILDFQRDFRDAAVIKLERNYRSTKPILEAANNLVSHNTQRLGKNLWTERDGGHAVKLFAAPTDREEAAYAADTIQGLKGRFDWRQMAVLYRTNAQSRSFEEACLNRGIPYQVIGGLRFYERKEIKDILAYLRVALNPLDRVALLRVLNVPPRGIGKVTVEQLEKMAREDGGSLLDAVRRAAAGDVFPTRATSALKGFLDIVDGTSARLPNVPPADLVEWVLSAAGYVDYIAEQSQAGPDPETRLENIRELVSAMREFENQEGGDLRLFLERQALYSDQDDLKNGAMDAVKLMTLHAAKGLEFPVVFLAGLEQDLCPHVLSSQSEDGVEEERRLCYVGMTRAMDTLHLSWARQRYVYGQVQERLPSPFLREIPAALIEEVKGVGGAPMGLQEAAAMLEKANKPKAAPKLRVGARVHHAKYGFGIVLSTEGSGDALKVTVSFNRHGRKKLLANLARLEIV
jgi:DNA helicase-2/ATP-dependent DNA helicase PcrA